MLAIFLSLLSVQLDEPRWTGPDHQGFVHVPAPQGSAFLELELDRYRTLEVEGMPGFVEFEGDPTVGYRLVLAHDRQKPPLRRTPPGARYVDRATLRPEDEVLAEGTFRRAPVAVAVFDGNAGFALLEEPFEGPAGTGSWFPEGAENPHFLQVYDGSGHLRYERGPSEVLTPEGWELLLGPWEGCGTRSPSEEIHDLYRDPPGSAGLWVERGQLHVEVRTVGRSWVFGKVDIAGGERVSTEVERWPYALFRSGPCVGGDRALALLLESDPDTHVDLEAILANEDAPLEMRVRAADHLGRRHRRAGRKLLLEVAGTREFDRSRAFAVGLAAQALGHVLDRAEASLVIDLVRTTPYARDPFGQALQDMEDAGARALALALADEVDPELRAFFARWLVLEEIRPDDPEGLGALGRIAQDSDPAGMGPWAWMRLEQLAGPQADGVRASVIAGGGPAVRSRLEELSLRERAVLAPTFVWLEDAGDEEVRTAFVTKLRQSTDALAGARSTGERAPETWPEWRAWWARAQDRPQRYELLRLAEGVARRGEAPEGLLRALEASVASADPAGAHHAAEALLLLEGRVRELGLREVWRGALAGRIRGRAYVGRSGCACGPRGRRRGRTRRRWRGMRRCSRAWGWGRSCLRCGRCTGSTTWCSGRGCTRC